MTHIRLDGPARWGAVVVMVLTGVLLTGPAHAQLLPFTHYTPKSEVRPLPSAEVHAVTPDQEGYLWIVVYSSGLVRYDGARMELYDESDGLRDAALWEAVQDRAGRLWVASNGGVVVSERPLAAYGGRRRVTFSDHYGGVPLLDVTVDRNQLVSDMDGRIWVGTDGLGIVRYSLGREGGRADTVRLARAGEEPPAVRTLLARSNGDVWVGLSDGRLAVASRGRLPFYRVVTLGDEAQSPTVLFEKLGGPIWVGTRDGAVWRVAGRDSLVSVLEPQGSPVVSLELSAQGDLVVATGATGLFVVPLGAGRGAVRQYTRQNGLLGDGLHDLARDGEGNLWIAQSGGLSKLRSGYSAFTAYTAESVVGERPLLPAAAVGAVEPARLGGCDIWVGTAEGVGCVTQGARASGDDIGAEEGLESAFVNALVADSDRLWIGTLRGIAALAEPGAPLAQGAQRVQTVRVQGRPLRLATYGGASVLGAEAFPLPLADSTRPVQSVWFAAYRRLFGLVDGRWIQLDVGAGLPQSVFHGVAVDAEGRLWVGSRDQGLWRSRRRLSAADLDRWAMVPSERRAEGDTTVVPLFEQIWSSASGAPTDQIEALLRIGDEMWTATPAGLFSLRDRGGRLEVVAALGESEGLPSVRVFSLAQSPTTGALWVGTNGGLTEVDPETRRVRRTLTYQDGLIGNEVWYYGSVRADDLGRIYFGTAQGLSVFEPSKDIGASAPPRLHLRVAEVVRKANGYTEASFQYAATSFADERAVLYRYRLDGYEDEWSEPTSDPTVRYTNLRAYVLPRTYTLEVLGGTTDGPWTPEPLRATFQVRPPWWFGVWAFLGYGLLFALAVFGVDRFQRRRLVNRERERTRLREATLEAEAARAEQAATEARARALSAEAERQASELSKARELAEAFHRLEETHHNLVETQTQLVQQEKMASLGRLTAGVAHELKNPLNFVTNFAHLSAELTEELAELLASPSADQAEEVQDLLKDLRRNSETIETHGRRADEIVRHMLLHSRGTAGPRRPVVLNDIVEDGVRMAEQGRRAADPEAEVVVRLTMDRDRPRVLAAPLELGRVIVNLYDNAYDAVRTRVRSAGPDYVPTIEVTTDVVSGAARIRVSDNGTGIPDDVRGKIFEPFFTTKPTGEGTGLGLSLSFDIVRQHGGVLSTEQRHGGGTVFAITIPLAPDHGDAGRVNTADVAREVPVGSPEA